MRRSNSLALDDYDTPRPRGTELHAARAAFSAAPTNAYNRDAVSIAVGSRLGPYEVISPIGVGGMGEIYRAHDSRLGRHVAIKVLPRSSRRSLIGCAASRRKRVRSRA